MDEGVVHRLDKINWTAVLRLSWVEILMTDYRRLSVTRHRRRSPRREIRLRWCNRYHPNLEKKPTLGPPLDSGDSPYCHRLIIIFHRIYADQKMAALTASKPIPLGSSVPALTAHAISVSLPTWEDNIGYEEGDKRVVDRMETGYPRFFIHRSIQKVHRPEHLL